MAQFYKIEIENSIPTKNHQFSISLLYKNQHHRCTCGVIKYSVTIVINFIIIIYIYLCLNFNNEINN